MFEATVQPGTEAAPDRLLLASTPAPAAENPLEPPGADAVPGEVRPSDPDETDASPPANVIPLADFIAEFGDGLLAAVREQNPPVFDGTMPHHREAVLDRLARTPFMPQRQVVHAVSRLLVDEDQPAAIINAEMGTGKTCMAIATAAVMHAEGIHRCLVISPPHLVYKWRREIRQMIPDARVWILNGPDTLRKLLSLQALRQPPEVPEFFVLGRVRMRMGFHWQPVCLERRIASHDELGVLQRHRIGVCPRCFAPVMDADGHLQPYAQALKQLDQARTACQQCGEQLWTLMRPRSNRSQRDLVIDAIQQIPTLGERTATRLVDAFGADLLGGMLADNVFEFINLMNDDGELFFSDRQARRMERAMANLEFSCGEGGYQATEYVKRYLPQGYFGLLVVDEAHEYKNEGSAQGQAMGVLARKCRKTLLLTGTLMGGYADDVFHLLWRLDPKAMIADGFGYSPKPRRSLGPAVMAFMREHGVIKDIYKEVEFTSHRTARGKSMSHRTAKGPGFGPRGIMRFVLPITAFLKLRDIGGAVLPPYQEHFVNVAMTDDQSAAYRALEQALTAELKRALRFGDKTLLGVVLNCLLAWPDTAFRPETVRHPRTKSLLAHVPALFTGTDPMPKEEELLRICRAERDRGRRVLVYSIYTGTRDTTTRLQALLQQQGFKVGVLRASVEAAKREDWLFDQVDRGAEIIITNPELVKTGLDMLEFPTIVFMQSGFNVYTLQQASRRSWRIGQKQPVDVYFLGYAGSAQMACLSLMAQKIAVSQSTSGDMPDSGLDVLNQGGDSIEMALARELVDASVR